MDGAPGSGVHVLLLIGGQAIEGYWDAGNGNVAGEWKVVRLKTHGCGCCGSDDDVPTGWAPLPVLA